MKTSVRSEPAGKYWNSATSTKKASWPSWIMALLWTIAVCWSVGTLYMETRAHLPADRAEWGHRAIGWFVSIILIRTFLRGLKRIQALRESHNVP